MPVYNLVSRAHLHGMWAAACSTRWCSPIILHDARGSRLRPSFPSGKRHLVVIQILGPSVTNSAPLHSPQALTLVHHDEGHGRGNRVAKVKKSIAHSRNTSPMDGEFWCVRSPYSPMPSYCPSPFELAGGMNAPGWHGGQLTGTYVLHMHACSENRSGNGLEPLRRRSRLVWR